MGVTGALHPAFPLTKLPNRCIYLPLYLRSRDNGSRPLRPVGPRRARAETQELDPGASSLPEGKGEEGSQSRVRIPPVRNPVRSPPLPRLAVPLLARCDGGNWIGSHTTEVTGGSPRCLHREQQSRGRPDSTIRLEQARSWLGALERCWIPPRIERGDRQSGMHLVCLAHDAKGLLECGLWRIGILHEPSISDR